ncbi:methionine biosynthesis protein MetW [Marinimicrobium sp. C6131]|uniref:methionine biosynthesis protein MetW n=1 Tax=Marinimicrobium sp. C6131 TaxID=3022676 RepID=UPI00223CFEB8|nr:methionine biosynthesis protein MetW [Marinimicrobium sp. C6131]UZJ46247.1 methionine biosynthesis protein MetW [Marinimicrobium sp. C6131]
MRLDQTEIQHWIAEGSRILDLGCGDGTLLKYLQETKNTSGYGLEIGAEQINACIDKGLNVIEQNLDEGLGNFADQSFDTVIMAQAIQTMHYPHKVLDEMLRVGKECIVTFPNFGHWKARWHLAVRGRMPVSDLLPFEWYDTPNIHFCTFRDFEVLCRDKGITVLHRQVVNEESPNFLKDVSPNLFGETAIYHLCLGHRAGH